MKAEKDELEKICNEMVWNKNTQLHGLCNKVPNRNTVMQKETHQHKKTQRRALYASRNAEEKSGDTWHAQQSKSNKDTYEAKKVQEEKQRTERKAWKVRKP